MVMERALKPFEELNKNRPLDESEHVGNIENMILDRCWEWLTQESETMAAMLVREFYTNVIEQKGRRVKVKGGIVSFF